MSDYRFETLDAAHDQLVDEQRRGQLLERSATRQALSLKGTASKYVPDDELRSAINTAIALSMPLLLTGEPGTGKTQVAYHVGYRLNLPVIHFQARSTSTATDLLYHFDTVRYFHDAQVGRFDGEAADVAETKRAYVTPCELWEAFETAKATGAPAVLLIDEIDKAPRDFPNDLLHEVSEMSFRIKEIPELKDPIDCPTELRPLIFITSNDERRLPDAFLRRCISHHIELDDELLLRVARSHGNEYPLLDEEFVRKAVERFMEIRGRKLEKPPASGELLNWLQVLSIAVGGDHHRLDVNLPELPYLNSLLKSPDTSAALR